MQKSNERASLEIMRIMLEITDMAKDLAWREGWPQHVAFDVLDDYLKFWILALKYPEKVLIPTRSVDLLWRRHILDTERYTEDCERILGYFLHHRPSHDPGATEGSRTWSECFEETRRLYLREFGAPPATNEAATSENQLHTSVVPVDRAPCKVLSLHPRTRHHTP